MQARGIEFAAAKLETGYGKVHDHGIGAQILKDVGVKKIRLLTNHPPKLTALDAFDLEIVETVRLYACNLSKRSLKNGFYFKLSIQTCKSA